MFDNIDVLSVIINFLPYESKLIIHRVSKIFLQFEEKCKTCKGKMCLPVVFMENLHCYYCTTVLLSRSDIKLWDKFDKLSRDYRNRSYLNCSKCNLRCKNSEWYHYHISFNCALENKS